MTSPSVVVASLLALCTAASVAHGAPPKSDPPPAWAFVISVPHVPPRISAAWTSVPHSSLRVKPKRLADPSYVPDWFPADHQGMPGVVAHGRAPLVPACAWCHLPTGVGDPAAAAIAGLPAAYIEQQFAEFRSGRRRCAVAKDLTCSAAMLKVARAITPADLSAAADYFAHLSYHSRIGVIETARAPMTRNGGFELLARVHAGTEPIGDRIIEVPEDALLEYEGDWRSGITAYVAPGSIARGKALVRSGAGAAPCASCHGLRFQGGDGPPLAGRSPTYIVRQLYDIQYGYRSGPAVASMEPEVAHLSARDRLDIAAYLASLGETPASPRYSL
jgi:cytochrome c553